MRLLDRIEEAVVNERKPTFDLSEYMNRHPVAVAVIVILYFLCFVTAMVGLALYYQGK